MLLALKMEKESQVKECEQPLETGKGKDMRYPPESQERNRALLTPCFSFNFLFCVWVKPINVVIVSGEQQRDSAIHVHASILSQLPSHPDCHLTLSRVPGAVQ